MGLPYYGVNMDDSRRKMSENQKRLWREKYDEKLAGLRSAKNAYVLSDPNGVEYTIERGMLSEFCKEHNLPVSSLSARDINDPLQKGRGRGWTVISRT